MPSAHDGRMRAVICRDCWFWREMSCALPSPEGDSCANRRPVHGRVVEARAASANIDVEPAVARQAPPVTPLLPATPVVPATPSLPVTPAAAERAQPAAPALVPAPFAEQGPERTFSLVEVAPFTPPPSPRMRAAAAPMPPHGAAVTISAAESGVDGFVQPVLPGMEQLVERVRRRTAARLSRNHAAGTTEAPR